MPLPEPMDATGAALLIHMPLPPSVNVMVEPTHTAPGPDMADGAVFTVTTTVETQPPPSEYVTVVVPEMFAESMPLSDPIPATLVLLLVQVPPATVLVRVNVLPGHSAPPPLMAPGAGLTVTVFVTEQPVGSV